MQAEPVSRALVFALGMVELEYLAESLGQVRSSPTIKVMKTITFIHSSQALFQFEMCPPNPYPNVLAVELGMTGHACAWDFHQHPPIGLCLV